MAFLRSGTRVPASAEEEEAPCADMRLSAERCIERGWRVDANMTICVSCSLKENVLQILDEVYDWLASGKI